MKIIEALKELPTLEKRINDQATQIAEYAGLSSAETSPFGGEATQREKVAALVQSNIDLSNRFLKIKKALAKTNAETQVTIEGETKTITEWIAFKSNGFNQTLKTYKALNLDRALQRMRTVELNPTAGIKLDRMYDEDQRNQKIAALTSIFDKIDGTLEVVNATTDLVEAV